MTRPTHFRPSERSRWLAELSAALDKAQAIMARLDDEACRSVEALHLAGRIAALRSEVDRLRRGNIKRLTPQDHGAPGEFRWREPD